MTDQNLMAVTNLYQTFLMAKGRRVRPLVLTSLSPEYFGQTDFDLEEATFQLLPATPGHGISFERFRNISAQVVKSTIWDQLRYISPPEPEWERALSDIRSKLGNLQETHGFGISAIHDLVHPEHYASVLYPFPYFWSPYLRDPHYWSFLLRRFGDVPLTHVIFSSLYWTVVEERRLDVDPEEFGAWVEVAERLTRRRSSRIEQIVNTYLEYEVPYSLSPQLKGQKISDILAQLRNAIYLPLAPAAIYASQAVTEGNWVLGMKIALAGGGTVVILAASVGFAEYLMNLPKRQIRRRR